MIKKITILFALIIPNALWAQPTSIPASQTVLKEPTSLPTLALNTNQRLQQKITTLSLYIADLQTLLHSKHPQKLDHRLFDFDLDDPDLCQKEMTTLKSAIGEKKTAYRQKKRHLADLNQVFHLALKRLNLWRKKHAKNPKIKIPKRILSQGLAAEETLDEVKLKLEHLAKEITLSELKVLYLEQSQPQRIANKKKRILIEKTQAEEKKKAEEEAKRAEKEKKAAEKAKAEALLAEKGAKTEAQRLIAIQQADLQEIRLKQAEFKQNLALTIKADQKEEQELELFRGKISGDVRNLKKTKWTNSNKIEKLHDAVQKKLQLLRPLAINALNKVTHARVKVPEPPAELDTPIKRLAEGYSRPVAQLTQTRNELAKVAEELNQKSLDRANRRLKRLNDELDALNIYRLALFEHASAHKRRELIGINEKSAIQLGQEIKQLVFDALYWSYSRIRQIDQIPRLIFDIFSVGKLLWIFIKIIFLILLLKFILRRWEKWMDLLIRRIGHTSYGQTALRLTRLADALRLAGPSLLVLANTILIYYLVGGPSASAEIQVLYIFLFWISIYRIQLRIVQSAARFIGVTSELSVDGDEENKDEEKESDSTENEITNVKNATKTIIPANKLLVRSVRAATIYILIVLLILDITKLAVGKGTLYGLTFALSWWAAVPFIFYFLRLWKPHIVNAYQKLDQKSSKKSILGRLVLHAQDKFYGVFVIGAALIALFTSKIISFVQHYFTSLDATKKLLAFLFRRQVEKHAQEQGRVVNKRQELPEELLRHFLFGPLLSSNLPERQDFMDDIKSIFSKWSEDQSDGSIALVGRAGMGKSTTIQMLESELGCSVLRGEIRKKITRPTNVIGAVAEIFGINPKPNSENELIRAIIEDKHRVVAIDNAHNFFLRQVNGFKGWESFVRIVNETCDNVFWLISFNQTAWDYLNNISGRVHYFRRLIQMPAWSEDQLRKMLIKRMRRARYSISFSDLVVSQIEGLAANAQLGRTASGYFRLLWDQTGGNPRLANHLWLDSLVPNPNKDNGVFVHLFSTPQNEKLDKLSDDILFILTAITEHQNLNSAETAAVTNLSLNFCKFALKLSLEEEFLIRDGSGRYTLSARWQVPIIRYLKRKHLLYG